MAHALQPLHERGGGGGQPAPGLAGFGTSAVDIGALLSAAGAERLRRYTHVPYQKVGPSLLPDFSMPFELALSPHLDGARDRLTGWMHEKGMLQEGVWDEDKLAAYDLPLCAAGIHPDATEEALDLGSQWLAWGTYGDDYYPLVFGHRRDLAAAKLTTDRLSACMPIDGEPTPLPAGGMEHGLLDLWERTTAKMTPDERRKLRGDVDKMTESWVWELSNQLQHRIPDPIDYLEMRRATFGSDLTLNLCRLGHGPKVPPEVYRSGPVRSLENAAIDYAMLINDVFSYQKEIEYEGEVHNAILVVQNFFGCDYPTGLGIIHDLMTQRMQQFQHVAAHELPVLYEDFKLSQEVRGIMDGYVAQLQNWLSGILKWHQDCHRYGAADLARRAHGFVPDRAPAVPFPGAGAVPGQGPQAGTEAAPVFSPPTAAGAVPVFSPRSKAETQVFRLPTGTPAVPVFSPRPEAEPVPELDAPTPEGAVPSFTLPKGQEPPRSSACRRPRRCRLRTDVRTEVRADLRRPHRLTLLSGGRVLANGGGFRPALRYEGTDVRTLTALAAAGHGLALLPRTVATGVPGAVAVPRGAAPGAPDGAGARRVAARSRGDHGGQTSRTCSIVSPVRESLCAGAQGRATTGGGP